MKHNIRHASIAIATASVLLLGVLFFLPAKAAHAQEYYYPGSSYYTSGYSSAYPVYSSYYYPVSYSYSYPITYYQPYYYYAPVAYTYYSYYPSSYRTYGYY